MNSDQIKIFEERWDHRCIVCDKCVDGGGGYAHLKIQNDMIALCCPHCMDSFQKNQNEFIARRVTLKNLQGGI